MRRKEIRAFVSQSRAPREGADSVQPEFMGSPMKQVIGTATPRSVLGAHFLAILVCALALPIAGAAQDAPTPQVLSQLLGNWVGEGDLLDQPARFSMEWTQDSAGFYHLSYRPAFADPSGGETPALTARAIYRIQGEGMIGVWLDDRPQRIQLTAQITDDAVVTEWEAQFEQGRTVYRVVSADEILVTDWVRSSGELRKFGEARYRRR